MTNCVLFYLCLVISFVTFFAACAKINVEPPKIVTTSTEPTRAHSDDSISVDNSKALIEPEISVNDTKAKDELDLMTAMILCNDSFRIEMSFLVSLNESGSFPDETDKTPKCFLRCILQSMEISSLDDGKIDPDRAAAIFANERDGEDIKDIATFCAQRDEKCHCEMAYNFLKCLFSMEIERNNKKSKS